ncbi:MAG: flagellar hook protein FlgE [Beijerinckiaceae bacterium]
MGLLNALQTSVSGMNAQSSYLSAVGDNIANSGTTGYKQATVDFETVLGQQSPGSYESGGVDAQAAYDVTGQGTLKATTSSTDLAIQGGGFFAVTNGGTGATYLTRAGSFSPDTTGNLVNTAGYTLMGYAIDPTTGLASSSLTPVNVSSSTLAVTPTTSGTLTGNLPSTAATGATETSPSFTVYDDLGTAVPITMNYTNNGSGSWTATAEDASGNTVGSATLQFNTTTGALTSPTTLSITPTATDGTFAGSISVNISGLTQLASGFANTSDLNGNAPSKLSSVTIGTDGTLTGVYASGATATLYDIPVVTVTSPDSLTSLNGDVYQQNDQSGNIIYNTAGTGSAGKIEADNLEGSTVDLATQLTNMIVAQSSYEANSKVLQTVADLLSKLNQIQTS